METKSKPQKGISVWILIAVLAAIAGLSAIGGYLLLKEYDNQAVNSYAQDSHAPDGTPSLAEPGMAQPHEANARIDTQEGNSADDGRTPVTDIDLTLKGIVTRSNRSRSRALIAKGNAPEQAYQPGDKIISNVILSSVEGDHVILEIAGRPEKLYLNRTLGGRASSGEANTTGTTKSLADTASPIERLLGRHKIGDSAQGLLRGLLGRNRDETRTQQPSVRPTDSVASSDQSELADNDDDSDWEDEDWEDEDWDDEDWDDEDWDDEDWDDEEN